MMLPKPYTSASVIAGQNNQDYNLTPPTTCVVCANLIHEWRDLQFELKSERQIIEKLFMAIVFILKDLFRNVLRE